MGDGPSGRRRVAAAFILMAAALGYLGLAPRPALSAGPTAAGGAGPAPTPAGLTPLTEGKTVKVKGLETVPLEATVPPKFKFHLDSGGEDFGPRGHLKGPGLDILIEERDKFVSLAKQREYLNEASPVTVILHSEENADGYMVTYEARRAESDTEYGAPEYGSVVARPKLGVACSIDMLERRADAELAARVCLSLRAAQRPVVDLSKVPGLSPLTTGKAVPVDGFEPLPLELTLPPRFARDRNRIPCRSGPCASFEGPGDTRLEVRRPNDGRFPSMAEQRTLLLKDNPSVTFVRADESPDGYLLIYRKTITGAPESYDLLLSRPALKATCAAYAFAKLGQAEQAAAMCLSLRAATAKTQ